MALFAWCLLALLGLCILGSWLVYVPHYVAGTAIVVQQAASPESHPAEVVVLLPPERSSEVRVGQHVWLRFDSPDQQVQPASIRTPPELLSRAEMERRFGLGTDVTASLGRVSFAVVSVAGAPTAASSGEIGRADVLVGSRRLIARLVSGGA